MNDAVGVGAAYVPRGMSPPRSTVVFCLSAAGMCPSTSGMRLFLLPLPANTGFATGDGWVRSFNQSVEW